MAGFVNTPSVPGSPFDHEAPSYDERFEANRVTHHIRQAVWKSCLQRFSPGDHVLDIACGTGTDAVMLARHGIRVTAFDGSPAMIDLARKKVRSSGLAGMVDVHCVSFDGMDAFQGLLFDGAISNFGGLNCAPSLPGVLESLHALLKPGRYFIASFLNSLCLWETLAFFLRGDMHQALRRQRKDGVEARVGESGRVRVRYYSLRELHNLLGPGFAVRRSYALNVLSPPPNSRSFASEHPSLTSVLLRFDDLVRSAPPWRGFGDHIVVEAQHQNSHYHHRVTL